VTGLAPLPASVRRAAIVSGYFNPLHIGHLDMMESARELADALVVIVNNDAQQELKKGKVITSETDRLRIVDALRMSAPEALCQCELTPLFDMSQQALSKHLKVLIGAGVIGSERRGLWTYYFGRPDGLAALQAWLS
jgi:cytidyltransferase-like protein